MRLILRNHRRDSRLRTCSGRGRYGNKRRDLSAHLQNPLHLRQTFLRSGNARGCGLGRIHGRAPADRNDAVAFSFPVALANPLHGFFGGIVFHFAEQSVAPFFRIQRAQRLSCNPPAIEVGTGDNQRPFASAFSQYFRKAPRSPSDLRAAPGQPLGSQVHTRLEQSAADSFQHFASPNAQSKSTAAIDGAFPQTPHATPAFASSSSLR